MTYEEVQADDRLMHLKNYIADVTTDGTTLLDDWEWLLEHHYSVWFVTKFGDAFLRDKAESSIALLDVSAGAVHVLAADEKQFLELATQASNFDRWFMREAVDSAAALGMVPGKDQCVSFIKPSILGGELRADNLEITNAAVHLSFAGQIHQQVRDLPAGTRINSVSLAPSISNKPWWKLW